MSFTKIMLHPSFFSERPQLLLEDGEFSATLIKYTTGVCGLQLSNKNVKLVILPYMGQQIWFAEFCGKNLTEKSIFDEPQATVKWGDNYGALLIHCGLINMGNPEPHASYPLHGELPFADYQEVYVGLGRDEKGRYLAAGGSYQYRNSQEYNYKYKPELRLYEGATVLEMHIAIENLRTRNPLDYLYMCHINWLAVDKSRIVFSAPKDKEHIEVYSTQMDGDSERAKAMRDYCTKLMADPSIGDTLDSASQCYDPEICTNIKYISDSLGWSHAMQIMPEGDSCYVGFRTKELPYALRWMCRTGDEDGCGIALPSTGNCLGSDFQRANGLFNTIPPTGIGTMRFDFGYKNKEQTFEMEQHINEILSTYEEQRGETR
jgi:hypothetical protein